MITKTFYSLHYQDQESFEKAVSEYATAQEEGGFEVEVTTDINTVLIPVNMNPIADSRGQQKMNAALNVVTSKTVNSYVMQNSEESEAL